MKNFKFVLLLILASLAFQIKAQDARFSQFYTAPLHNNPALTGIFPGKFRVGLNYRNQWSSILGSSAFNTYQAAFDMRFRTSRNDFFAVGVNLLRDDAGDARFNQTKANLSASFIKQLVGGPYKVARQYIGIGFQVGMGQNGIDWNQLSFSNQFNNTTEQYSSSNPTGEDFGIASKIYTDINAGLTWYALFEDNLSIYSGIALHHIGQPDISFYDEATEILFSKIIFQLGGQIPFSENLSILPAAKFMLQGPSNETNVGLNVRYSNNDHNELALRAGGWIRMVNGAESSINVESFIVTSMIEIERFLIGISYDFTLSTLSAATDSRGSFELSFAYIHPEKSRYKVECPRF